MPNQSDPKLTSSQSHLPRLSSTSYVYPLRSLLEGRIQPAAQPTARPPLSSRSSDDVSALLSDRRDSQAEFESTLAPMGRFPDSTQSPHSPEPRGSSQRATSYSIRRATSIPDIGRSSLAKDSGIEEAEGNTSRRKSTRKKSSRLEQKFLDQNPYFPRTFSSFSPSETLAASPDLSSLESVQSSMSADQVLGSQIHDIFQRGPYSLYASPLPDTPTTHRMTNTYSQLPDALPDTISKGQAGQDLAFRSLPRQDTNIGNLFMADMPTLSSFSNNFDPVATPLATYPGGSESNHNQGVHRDERGLRLPFNPSEYGIVHMPPLSSSTNTSERGSSASSRSFSKGSNNAFKSTRTGPSFPSGPNSAAASRAETNTSVSATGASAGTPFSGQSQREPSEHFSSDGVGSSIASDEPYVTMRYRSIEDENGNHVIIGHTGKLQACEDEPIRTPGAVQGFGVLVAVEEMNDALHVRQVSENSTEILGLPPQFLFGLHCFTDTLPDIQAGILWDNIEFLDDPEPQSDEEECSPHVFLLSGYGAPGSALPDEENSIDGKRIWTCWCAAHRSQVQKDGLVTRGHIIMEFELEKDTMNPLYPPASYQSSSMSPSSTSQSVVGSDDSPVNKRRQSYSPYGTSSSGSGRSTVGNLSLPSSIGTPPFGLEGDSDWLPPAEDIIESTTSYSRPLPALERLRKVTRAYGNLPDQTYSKSRRGRGRAARGSSTVGMMDIFAVMTQIHEQLGAAPDLSSYLKVVVGVIKDLTQFHRVMVYQFDEMWNGEVVAELVDWGQSKDLFRGLHFPASDIPAQARQLYEINKVRLLYDASQPTARIIVRSKEDLETPLNMTHCYLRAMSPIHIQYLGNMGVRASMSISIMSFGRLWGLVNCHTYGTHGMRVSFPVRQMLRLLSQTISKNVERLSYAKRLHTRKLINTMVPSHVPTGYIVSNADDLLGLFDADFGILVIGEGAKILGPNQHGQEILIMAEYLRLKQFNNIQASQAVIHDFPDLELTAGLEIIAGLLYVPLSSGGQDFIAFLRKGQPRKVRWAGRPTNKDAQENKLEPRTSFKMWSETVAGRSRTWTDEQLETAAVLALVYGKFIEVWRQKESAMQTTKLTNLLLSNASHEVRTPLNHIINYLEMAMNGPLDTETRENLKKSHTASKSLLFTINDLLDLTRLETGNEITFNEPFDLHFAIAEATDIYRNEAARRSVKFHMDLKDSPRRVIGDTKKIRTVVQNLTANALKYTTSGSITVSCTTFGEPEGLRSVNQTAVEILVSDTGCGIPTKKLASIFREFEQVESSEPKSSTEPGVGLGLAVVARIVEQLGGQLRVDSTEGKGSRFSFLIPLALATDEVVSRQGTSSRSSGSSRAALEIYGSSRTSSMHSHRSGDDSINSLIQAISLHSSRESIAGNNSDSDGAVKQRLTPLGAIRHGAEDIHIQLQVPVMVHSADTPAPLLRKTSLSSSSRATRLPPRTSRNPLQDISQTKLRVLIVEDNDINRTILAKRLTMDGHAVVNTTNGQEGLDRVVADRSFDVVLMDLQMPILNGFQATRKIREFEKAQGTELIQRSSHVLNGRLPVFAVSASLVEHQRDELAECGMDGWILKPIDFKRLKFILKGVVDRTQRRSDVYQPGYNWERGGWLRDIAVDER